MVKILIVVVEHSSTNTIIERMFRTTAAFIQVQYPNPLFVFCIRWAKQGILKTNPFLFYGLTYKWKVQGEV